MMQLEKIRQEFPALGTQVYGKPLVYLDNAATSQRPLSVIRKWEELSTERNANLHRAVHRLADLATQEYEATRDAVRQYLNAASREEIIFTSGATASINLVAFSFGEAFVREGDEIIVCEAEHHSDIVPWQMLCERKGAVLKVLPVDDGGRIRLGALPALLTPRTRLLCVAHISNVLGLVNPIKEIVKICHSAGCPVLVDGSQGIVHERVDVAGLDCDFYVFSGHKVYAAPGTGVLYGRRELLSRMPPYMGGGEMIETVRWSGTTYAPLPQKFEAGTQNIAGTPTLRPALEMVKRLRDPEILAESNAIKSFMLNGLNKISGLRLYGEPSSPEEKIPLFSFSVEQAHHEDLALILDKMGIAVRSGQMCAEPLMDRFGVTGMLRVSFAPYNTLQEAEYFMQSLERAIKMLRG
ncbi:MAG: SufS family cysteine desulfurase [Bacteroidales bacterium]|jgi:cysteine desulfurase/selenocysteine lyase|nr:SufS family cysteine desulfurase [Bacteroidales bacterium]